MRNFGKLLKADFTRAFHSSGFFLGVLSTLAIFCFGSVGMVSRSVSAVAAFNNTFKYNNISQMMFLTATFAYSTSFCTDMQTRFMFSLTIRSGKTSYTLSKAVAALVSGGLTIALGTAIFIAGLCVIQPTLLPSATAIEFEFSPQAFGDLLLMGHPSLYFLSYLYVMFLQGAFFSALGLMLSAFLPNKYVAYIAPFSLSFILNQIASALRLPIWLDPVKLSTVKMSMTPTPKILLTVTAAFICFILVCACLFTHTAKRRLSHA